ncbi:MAG: class I SAM-dependent methyltransferase [Alphaproteobacteria bacterium]|nr:class I SAM-dependent methyltransferase [Alphaproteobacteria bacterium]
MLLDRLIRPLIKAGCLTVIDAHGRVHRAAGLPGPAVTIRLQDRALHRQLFFNPSLKVGEAFMDGTLTIEGGDIYDFLALVLMNLGWGDGHWMQTLRRRARELTRRLQQYNPVGRAQENVAHHYDLSDSLYDLFLDRDRQYSCAYHLSAGEPLELAQENKKRHIAAKLLLSAGHRVLDIGSGWGGLALYLSEVSGAEVTGVTLSVEQHKVSAARAAEAGLSKRVHFELKDYRELSGRFDRIVSVGMFEHVGVGHYGEYFAKVNELLHERGVMLLHTIGRADGPGATNPWLRKYIFPGGYVPALSEILRAVEQARLYVSDVEVLRLHYAETLKAWRQRFNANRERIRALYDERFCRMWEFYLAGCEANFRYGGIVVFQLQLAKAIDAVPLTRNYVFEWERRAAQRAAAA